MGIRILLLGRHPTLTSQNPFSSTVVAKISVTHSGWRPISSKALSHCDNLIKPQSHTNHRVMLSLILYWDELLRHRSHTLEPILKTPWSASVKSRELQSCTISVFKSIIFSPSIIPPGLPAPWRGCYGQLSKKRMFQAQTPGAQFQPEQSVKVNLVTVTV